MQNNDVYDLYANRKFYHQQDQYYVTNLVTQTSYNYVKAIQMDTGLIVRLRIKPVDSLFGDSRKVCIH